MITFTRKTETYDASTDTYTNIVTSTVTGNAIAVRGNPERYRALGLALTKSPTLFFSPTEYGLRAFSSDFVQPGDTCSWAGQTFTAQDVDPIAPDGIVIAARIIIGV